MKTIHHSPAATPDASVQPDPRAPDESLRGADDDRMGCPVCLDALDLWQPREDRPEHLIGSCDLCGGCWSIVDGPDGPVLYPVPTRYGPASAA